MSLPKLPAPLATETAWKDYGKAREVIQLFTADQMRAYAESAIASLKSQLVEAQKDALRYRWLYEHGRWTYDDEAGDALGFMVSLEAKWTDTLSDAIDKEMGKSEAAEQPSDRAV